MDSSPVVLLLGCPGGAGSHRLVLGGAVEAFTDPDAPLCGLGCP
jgi:hypothetical protein